MGHVLARNDLSLQCLWSPGEISCAVYTDNTTVAAVLQEPSASANMQGGGSRDQNTPCVGYSHGMESYTRLHTLSLLEKITVRVLHLSCRNERVAISLRLCVHIATNDMDTVDLTA